MISCVFPRLFANRTARRLREPPSVFVCVGQGILRLFVYRRRRPLFPEAGITLSITPPSESLRRQMFTRISKS